MSESFKYRVVKVLSAMLAVAVMAGCSSGEPKDGEWDPDNLKGYFPPFQNCVMLPSEGGVGSITAYGMVGEDGIAVKCISTKEIGIFDNALDYVDENMALDVKAYCEAQGYETYPNEPDFFVSFKWVEINTVKPVNERDGLITVRLAPNPYNRPRFMWVRLQNEKVSVLTIFQERNIEGISD